MILQGNQRGGAKDLALHLLKSENDRVEVHELRGFVADDLVGALNEAYAVSRGTKAKQFLFSLSLNPPPEEKVSKAEFEAAIVKVEDKLGLSGQPRAIVFHEKNGRRHCHAVWSRTDIENMKAVQLSHTKRKLQEVSRELYIGHNWRMPRGFMNSKERDPRNFTLAEWQQAKRIGKDARDIKAALQDCWAVSDNQAAFRQALKERGFTLANGRRGFVALDHRCEVLPISKWVGIRAKDVRAKLTDKASLPGVEQAKEQIARDMRARLTELRKQHSQAVKARMDAITEKRRRVAERQRAERQALKEAQEQRQQAEARQRQERFHKGLRGFWDRLTGKHRRIQQQNEQAAGLSSVRDQAEKQTLVSEQRSQKQSLQNRSARLQAFKQAQEKSLSRDIEQYKEIQQKKRDVTDFKRRMRSRPRPRGPDRER